MEEGVEGFFEVGGGGACGFFEAGWIAADLSGFAFAEAGGVDLLLDFDVGDAGEGVEDVLGFDGSPRADVVDLAGAAVFEESAVGANGVDDGAEVALNLEVSGAQAELF